jgi:hypothetical protein
VDRVERPDPRKRLPQGVVDVDVRGAVPDLTAVQPLGEDVETGVHAAAAGERLEAQPVAVAGDHRIERGEQLRPVVAGGGHVGHRQQTRGGRLRTGEETGEETGVVLDARGRRAPGRLQSQEPSLRGGFQRGGTRVGHGLQ